MKKKHNLVAKVSEKMSEPVQATISILNDRFWVESESGSQYQLQVRLDEDGILCSHQRDSRLRIATVPVEDFATALLALIEKHEAAFKVKIEQKISRQKGPHGK